MTSTDPAEDLVPCMRSVQLSDGDRQLMSAFKDKVDGETDTYLHSEADPRYKGAHIPSRTFRILQAATGGADGGGPPPPAASRIGGPGQNRTVVVTMPTGGASGPAVPASQQEVQEPRKYTGGNIPSRSFRVLQQMTADDQGSAPVLQRPADGQPRRSPSHYAHGPESVTAATASSASTRAAVNNSTPVPPSVTAGIPTCERIEQERLQQQRERQNATNGRYAGGKIPSRAFQQLSGVYPAGEENGSSVEKEAVIGELRSVGAGQSPRPSRPSAVPSRSFRFLQQEYGTEEQEQEQEPIRSGPQESVVIPTTPQQQKQRMAATSKTYRLLQANPTAVPSVLGRNRR